MAAAKWYVPEDGAYAVHLGPGWETEPDPEDGGVDISQEDGAGELHLLAFALPPGEFPDPGEELFAFLDENEIVLEEDDLDDVELDGAGELTLCEYISEDEETGEADFWMVGVAVLPGALVFAHYTCAVGEEEQEREQIRAILSTLRLPPAE